MDPHPVTFRTGDLFDEDVEALVNAVNCVGVMGKGIALTFRTKHPTYHLDYAEACRKGEISIGAVHLHDTGRVTNPYYILSFPTKEHWRDRSHLRNVEAGLNDLVDVIKKYRIKSIALPALGCGLGGLEWSKVPPLIE